VSTRALLPLLLLIPFTAAAASDPAAITIHKEAGRLHLLAGGQSLATYVWADLALPRPYFCDIFAPDGTRLTRNYPPDPVADAGNADHPDFHPGLWLAFGDLGGQDFWRNKARVRHVEFLEPEKVPDGARAFAVRNVYEPLAAGAPLCEEICTYTILASPGSTLLLMDSAFTSAAPFTFGDQEEMGLGLRLATNLTPKHGKGRLRNSLGGEQEAGTWGKAADWCAATAPGKAGLAGVLLAPHPGNFRKSWFHTRDYGLIAANPFGQKAMTAAKDDSVAPDQTPVAAETAFRLRYAVCLLSDAKDTTPDLERHYQDVLELWESMAAFERPGSPR
jgi:hypothetical protein